VRLKAGDGKLVNGIAFRVIGTPLGQALLENRGRAVHAAGFVAIDRWQGEERVQLRLVDAAAVS
jgi:single-stranded-DNA-specific exonuclease